MPARQFFAVFKSAQRIHNDREMGRWIDAIQVVTCSHQGADSNFIDSTKKYYLSRMSAETKKATEEKPLDNQIAGKILERMIGARAH